MGREGCLSPIQEFVTFVRSYLQVIGESNAFKFGLGSPTFPSSALSSKSRSARYDAGCKTEMDTRSPLRVNRGSQIEINVSPLSHRKQTLPRHPVMSGKCPKAEVLPLFDGGNEIYFGLIRPVGGQ